MASRDKNKDKPRIAFIDDEPRVLRTLKMNFKRQYDVYTTTSPETFFEFIREHDIHVAISDQRMPLMNGVDILQEVKKISPSTVRILLTGYADISAIVASLNEGEIYRYLTKPWQVEELNNTIIRAIEYSQLINQVDDKNESMDNEAPVITESKEAKMLLLANDNVIKEQLTSQFLNKYQVETHDTAEAAIKASSQNYYKIIVADLSLPEDFTSLFEHLKKVLPASPVIALTNEQDSLQLIELINTGEVFRCLHKPISSAVLETQITQASKRHDYLVNMPKLIFGE